MKCSITPSTFTAYPDVDYLVELAACDPAVDNGTPVSIGTDASGASLDPLEGLENCNQVPAVFLAKEVGVYPLTVTYTSEAPNICIATGTATVIPPE